MVPLFRGLGYGMLTVRLLVNIYYVVIQAWSLFYLGVGFTSELPWGSCDQDFTTNDCYTIDYNKGQLQWGPMKNFSFHHYRLADCRRGDC